jgi:hypothetical protein
MILAPGKHHVIVELLLIKQNMGLVLRTRNLYGAVQYLYCTSVDTVDTYRIKPFFDLIYISITYAFCSNPLLLVEYQVL